MSNIKTVDEILNDLLEQKLVRMGRWEIDSEDIESLKRKLLQRLVNQLLSEEYSNGL